MNKQEAIIKAQEGHKITHRYFGPDEWFTIVGNKIHLEDGVICSQSEFWSYRLGKDWNDGYSIFEYY